jgi:teichuronic acid biosynthesis glycosyltransferase TuaC
MRIAVVTTSWPARAGDPAGHFVHAEVCALRRGGDEVVVVAPGAGGAFGWPGVAARVRERPLRVVDAAVWVARARRRLAGIRADRVIAHWAVPCAWPIASVGSLTGLDAELEVVSHGGDVRLLEALPAAARHFVAASIASRARRWRFVSAPLLASLTRALDRSTRARVEAIAVVEAAALAMPDVRDAVASRRRALGALRVAVTVGRLVPGKRVDRAIEHVARAGDLDALVVVGDGPERARLEALAGALGVDARFVGLVVREQALAWIGAADVLLHASEAEGLSTVVREAQALGTTVERLEPLDHLPSVRVKNASMRAHASFDEPSS